MLLTVIEGQGPAAEVLGLAHGLKTPVEAVAFASAEQVGDTAQLADELAGQGVGVLHLIRHEWLADAIPDVWGEALHQLITQLRPEGVIAAGNDHATEIMAHAAARARLPLATHCIAVDDGDAWQVTRTRGGGMLLEDAELVAPVKLVTVAPGAAGSTEAPVVQECVVREFIPELSEEVRRGRLAERTVRNDGVTLATAPVVVSGGRGVGSADGYVMLEELAELLGGAVGCSRVATNNGWRPHSDQVGLTGTKIAPDLYIACGISGATQHWVGCMDSKAILAINTDPEAPMVARATYAVIGDVHEIVPAVVAELKQRAGLEVEV